jgi:hypothetical protein
MPTIDVPVRRTSVVPSRTFDEIIRAICAARDPDAQVENLLAEAAR